MPVWTVREYAENNNLNYIIETAEEAATDLETIKNLTETLVEIFNDIMIAAGDSKTDNTDVEIVVTGSSDQTEDHS